jgi:hypothetical protein
MAGRDGKDLGSRKTQHKSSSRSPSQSVAGHCGTGLSFSAIQGSANKRIIVEVSSGIKQDPISKNQHKNEWQKLFK